MIDIYFYMSNIVYFQNVASISLEKPKGGHMKKIFLLFAMSVFLLTSAFAGNAKADYPYDRPLTIIVPFGPGGAVDIASRILADYFLQEFKITINVVTKPGGGQALGMNEMLHARPDGYTLAFPGTSALTLTPLLTNVGYSVKNVQPVAQITVMELVFSTHKAVGPHSFADFLTQAKEKPDQTVYASTGAITTQRLYLTKLLQRFHDGMKIRHAAYGSGHEVSTALLGKHINAGFQVPTNILPYVKSGDFQPVAITSKERSKDLPDTPTFRELYADKLTPDDDKWIDLGSWHGLVASSKVTKERIEALEPLLQKALSNPQVIEKFQKVGLSVDYLPPAEFAKVIDATLLLTQDVLQGRKSLD